MGQSAYGLTVQDIPLVLFKVEHHPNEIPQLGLTLTAGLGTLTGEDTCWPQGKNTNTNQGPATSDHASSAHHVRLGRQEAEECWQADQQRVTKVQQH